MPIGSVGVSVAPALALVGAFVSLISIREWRSTWHPVAITFIIFVGVLLISISFAAVYSGVEIAAASLARVGLLALSAFVFFYAYAGGADNFWNAQRLTRFLLWIAVAAAAFAVLDFYFQFPAPEGFSSQYIYLQSGVFRRAQGFFYEASTLGNFCAFFLVLASVGWIRARNQRVISRTIIGLSAVFLFSALVFSYSRASMLNVAVALIVLACIHRRHVAKPLAMIALTGILVTVAVHWIAPALSANYWGRLLGSFSFFQEAPDDVLSGRVSHWQTLMDFLTSHPWHAIFGVGYKTLPYSTFTGSTVIADNTYLELLVETGMIGIIAFLALNAAILRTGWRAIRSTNADARFYGDWVFCFWCGEIAQMLSGDLITYWRVLPVYFWVIGIAARKTEELA